MNQSDVFVKPQESDWEEVGPGLRRRVLGHETGLMLVEVAFEKGAEGAMHSHPHVQVSYVAEGAFEMVIGDRTTVLRKGESFYVPSGVEHGCKALEAGVLVDAFTPQREDMLG